MKTLFRKKTIVNYFLFMLLLLVLLVPWQTLAAPDTPDQPQLVINKIYVTNVRDVSFYVSWSTDGLSDGSVNWGTTPSLGNIATDPISNTSTHYVEISPLEPSTQYYFQVTSGGVTDPNIYLVSTGPTLEPNSAGRSIQGTLYEQNGITVVPYAIVYIQVQDNGTTQNGQSQWGSARTDAGGYWNFSLNNLRQEDVLDWFFMNNGADILRLVWQGGIKGAVGETDAPISYTLPTTYPATFNMNLDGTPTVVSLTNLVAKMASTETEKNYGFVILALVLSMVALLIGIQRRGEQH